MPKPLVSIIIPVYNTGQAAIAMIKSLLANDYPNFEILVVNDGSSDNSVDLLNSQKFPKTKIYSKPNGGPSSARNFGIKKAKGKYLIFVDSDDSVVPTFISQLVETIDSKKCDLAVSGVIYHNLSKNTEQSLYLTPFSKKPNEAKKAFILRSLLTDGRLYVVYNKIFRAELIKKHNLAFDETMNFAEDTKFVLAYLNIAKQKISFIPKALYRYNYGTNTSLAKQSEADWQKWRLSYLNLRTWLGPHSTFREKCLLRLVYLKWRIACFRAKRRARPSNLKTANDN